MRVFPRLGLQITAVCLSILLFSTSVIASGWGDSPQQAQGSGGYGSNAGSALLDAQQDAEQTNNGIWFFSGFCLSGLGIILAFAFDPEPPPSRFLGKSMDYVLIYSSEYRRVVKSKRVKSAVIGTATFCVLYVAVYVAVIAAVASSSNSSSSY